MNAFMQKPQRYLVFIIPIVLILAVATFFTVRTSGFGYFYTPTPTLTPTSTISLYLPGARSSTTPTPFQPLPTDTPTPTATSTFTPTPTNTATATATSTSTMTATPYPTATVAALPTNLPEDGWPNSYQITGFTGHAQSHVLSCESRAASDWAAFFGVSVSENVFQAALPTSYDNPDVGFVGSVDGAWGQIPPNDYGVHAAPVANLLRNYGLSAYASKGVSLSTLRHQVASGYPVMVWVVGNVWSGSPVSYTTGDGATTTVANYEHVVTLIGYDETGYTFVDGNVTYWRSSAVFSSSFAALGNMAITH